LKGTRTGVSVAVLDSLEMLKGEVLEKPNRGSIGEFRTNEEFIGLEHCHLLVFPESASDGFEDF